MIIFLAPNGHSVSSLEALPKGVKLVTRNSAEWQVHAESIAQILSRIELELSGAKEMNEFELDSLNQVRYEASASPDWVKRLLREAAKGGMTQKMFEIDTSEVRPGRVPKNERVDGFRGVLWHHYMAKPTRMRLITFGEYIYQFLDSGWIDATFAEEAIAYIESKRQALEYCKLNHPKQQPSKRLPQISSFDNVVLAQICHTESKK